MIAELDNAPAPWVINGDTDDTPAPLPTDEQIASLLKENERLVRIEKKAKMMLAAFGVDCYRKQSGGFEGGQLAFDAWSDLADAIK